MSAGAFLISKYQAKYGDGTNIHPIQLQPETLALTIDAVANAAPAGAINRTGSARVSGGRRQIGINAELVRIKFSGATPDGYKADGVITLPLLAPAIRAKAIRGAVGTYLTLPIIVVGTSSETTR